MDLPGLLKRFDASEAEAVELGFSGATVVRLVRRGETLYYKAGVRVEDEADRLGWLATTDIPAPRVLERGDGWMLTTELRGRDASQDWPAAERPAVLAALAEGLQRLHSLTECPFSSPFPGPRAVVTHGDYCAPNVFIDPATLRFSGILDVSRLGLGDPYLDLALMHTSLSNGLNPQYGGLPAARDFVVLAGADPDDTRIKHYAQLDSTGNYTS
ncbi:phosphotransferase [Kribbella sp. NPDC006257]|uniref:phosphotransferase n=1 Tax=Kribbella sp. NPDC006257 TaxID=3156738 RepID=UPI0033A5CC03